MRVVITGGSGVLGRALCADLAADGHEVVVLSRSPDRVRGLPEGARAEAWDGRSVGPWADLLPEAAVVHLAGAGIADKRWSADRKREIIDSRVLSSRAVADAIASQETRPRVLLQGSAVGYYGDPGDRQVDEDEPAAAGFLGETCAAWEEATESVEALGVRRPILRTGVVLTLEGGALARMVTPFRLGVGGVLGSGRQWFPWIHLADQVAAMRFLLDREDADGPYNLVAPEPVRNRELTKTLGRVLGRPTILPAPSFALRMVFGEMADVVLKGQRAVPRRLLEAGYDFQYPSLEGALRDLLAS